jgi:hypothetical protein
MPAGQRAPCRVWARDNWQREKMSVSAGKQSVALSWEKIRPIAVSFALGSYDRHRTRELEICVR